MIARDSPRRRCARRTRARRICARWIRSGTDTREARATSISSRGSNRASRRWSRTPSRYSSCRTRRSCGAYSRTSRASIERRRRRWRRRSGKTSCIRLTSTRRRRCTSRGIRRKHQPSSPCGISGRRWNGACARGRGKQTRRGEEVRRRRGTVARGALFFAVRRTGDAVELSFNLGSNFYSSKPNGVKKDVFERITSPRAGGAGPRGWSTERERGGRDGRRARSVGRRPCEAPVAGTGRGDARGRPRGLDNVERARGPRRGAGRR